MKLPSIKVYILIFLVLIILARILSVIRDTKNIYSQTETSILYQITRIKSNCWYSNQHFFFQIPDCHQAIAYETYVISGRIDNASDSSLISKKRLMVEDMNLAPVRNDSVMLWRRGFLRWRSHIWEKLSDPVLAVLPYPHSVVLLSMIFGEQEELGDETKELFRLTGTSHLQAVSGYNFAVIAAGIHQAVEKFARKRHQGLIILLASLAFTAIVGSQPSVIRAVASLITVLATRFILMLQHNSRFYLALVLYLMIMTRPEWLFSISFQLSAAAVAGILYFQPILEQHFDGVIVTGQKTPDKTSYISQLFTEMRSGFATAIAASLTTAPILLYYFHELSLIGIVVSSLFASILNLIVLMGFWTTVLGSFFYKSWLSAVLVIWINLVLYMPLDFFLLSIAQFSQVTFLNFDLEVFPWWSGVVYYCILICAGAYLTRNRSLSRDQVRLFI